MLELALFGAAGKMGARIASVLGNNPDYALRCVESGAVGLSRLRAAGFTPCDAQEAATAADVVVLAVPDVAIGSVAHQLVPLLKSGTLVITLDPAAAYGGALPARHDIAYLVTHPCHPSLANKDLPPDALRDYFGGIAPQALVCALYQGSEDDYVRGEAICRTMFAPVSVVHRITVEQMALLEPAMAETVALTCLTVVREAVDGVIAQGVPEAAAMDFILGHLNVSIAILFGLIDAQVSDGARLAVERARKSLFRPDWREVLTPQRVREQVSSIIHGEVQAE
ncbi:MAG: phosphogluconate dehydrogenase C-terminal domain-containing protein [Anaerolineae bacterium]|jgi:hypothetical protein